MAETKPANKTTDAAADFAAWVSDASAKATAGPASELKHGDVVDPDPRLHYAVLDGTAPKPTLDRQRAIHDQLGFRHMPDVKVIGYQQPVVMAIPKEVYRNVIRGARVRDVNDSMGKWGGLSMMVATSVKLS